MANDSGLGLVQDGLGLGLVQSAYYVCFSLYPGRIPFSYLEDIQMRFMKNYGRVANYAPAYAMNDEFSRVLHQQMEVSSRNHSIDTLNRVKGEVGEIHTIMVDNIEKILERGDRMELLVDKTSTMQDSAFHFRKQSKRLRRAFWIKIFKLL
ncbi:PREDICTED: vesicle-associated membrane protein 714-like [Lupinus angustifolius]|uniref:vesicle-associated membrane protein 714-like n=1 Tax=Lupinus angustifolius TaxID=3871 RepID=UPI00092EDE88|nr:PREDICTED: vesicle-associated membrane protein 714-like [Lupinus angustifolius]